MKGININMSKQLLEKLERYEQIAYDGGWGDEWIEEIGEGFKFHIRNCCDANVKPTIKGFEKYLDDLRKNDKVEDQFLLKSDSLKSTPEELKQLAVYAKNIMSEVDDNDT